MQKQLQESFTMLASKMNEIETRMVKADYELQN
jgi:hypothetical protein